MEIKVQNVLNSELAIFHNEGLQVYALIAPAIEKQTDVTVSFEGIERCSTQFLNAAIGKLYLEFEPTSVDKHLDFNYAALSSLKAKIDEVKENALNHKKHDALVAHASA